MKKQILFGIYFLIFVSLINFVSAIEYNLGNGNWNPINYGDKTLRLVRVGSSSIIVDVNGVTDSIPYYGSKNINGLEISILGVNYNFDYQGASSTALNVAIPGEVCHVDNFCDFKEINNPWNMDTQSYRGKTIELVGSSVGRYIIIKIDGNEIKLSSLGFENENPLDSIALINGVGIRYGFIDESERLRLGENFDNCPSDCPIDENKDIHLIKAFCHNKKEDEIIREEGIDCGGFCERDCGLECVEYEECIDKCNIIEGSNLGTCSCENNKCIDRTYCELDSDCVQVRNDLCGCDFISINKDYKSVWDNGINQIFSSKSCLNQCNYVEYNPICQNNKCILSKGTLKNNLYNFIDNIVKNNDYIIVLGDDAPSTDTLAASEINLKFQQYSDLKTNLPVELVSLVKEKENLILIGHPCDNPLISNPNCNEWSYETGQSLIKIYGNKLIIAGTTPEDTRNAATIVANYIDYSELKEKSEIVIGEKKEDTKTITQNKQEADSGLPSTNQTPASEESKIEQNNEKKEYKGMLHRFVSWIIGLFK